MPRNYRLSRGDFAKMRGFQRIQGSLFSLSYGRIPGRAFPGGACVVSSKIASRAVDRKRIQRRVREAVRPLLKKTDSLMIFVYYAKKPAVSASSKETADACRELFERAGTLA